MREGGVCEGVSVVSRESQPATLCGRGMPFSLHATAAAAAAVPSDSPHCGAHKCLSEGERERERVRERVGSRFK